MPRESSKEMLTRSEWMNKLNWWLNELFSDSIAMKQKTWIAKSGMSDEMMDAEWNSIQNPGVVTSIPEMRGIEF